MEVREIIESAVKSIAVEQQRRFAPLTDDLPLLNSGLDSLAFALLVVKLEDELGVDPFTESEKIQAPVTFGDFVELYERALIKADLHERALIKET